MRYVIYQIDNENASDRSYEFMPWEYAKDNGFSIRHYKAVYDGSVDGEFSLESMFRIFNIERPADFKGHSLSVSDIVSIKEDDDPTWSYHYCDSFGWTDITKYVTSLDKNDDRIAELAKELDRVYEDFDPYNYHDYLDSDDPVDKAKELIKNDPLTVIENLLQIAEELLNRV